MAFSRFYLDYNSTHPLKPQVLKALQQYFQFDANPSSQHSRGKQAMKVVRDTEAFLKDFFKLKNSEVLFHSGATEFFNTIFQLNEGDHFFYSLSDHSAIHEIAKKLSRLGVQTHQFKRINESVIEDIQKAQGEKWLNFQWMNNETGEVLPLALARKIKQHTHCRIHVDAVQTVGKIENFQILDEGLDCYTYSGHKFGALKGIGFSFYQPGLKLPPLVLGGGQQKGLRAGTLNTHGILSLKAALEGRDFEKEAQNVSQLKRQLELLAGKFSQFNVISNDSHNTICLTHKTMKSDAMLVHFDLAGLEVSSGSACTSGSLKPSQSLLALGLDDLADQVIRISLGNENTEVGDELLGRLESVFQKL